MGETLIELFLVRKSVSFRIIWHNLFEIIWHISLLRKRRSLAEAKQSAANMVPKTPLQNVVKDGGRSNIEGDESF
jgi:hypothetical protein